METVISRMRLKTTFKYEVTPATDVLYNERDNALIWLEKIIAIRIGEWIGQ